jgi:hypothetical protein
MQMTSASLRTVQQDVITCIVDVLERPWLEQAFLLFEVVVAGGQTLVMCSAIPQF